MTPLQRLIERLTLRTTSDSWRRHARRGVDGALALLFI